MNLFTQLFGGGNVSQLTPQQLKANLGRPQKPYLLDVRQPEEFREGHISGSRLIPLGDLNRRMKELPQEREIVCVCHSGNRSSSAARKLAAAGYNVSNLRGGMLAWRRAGFPMKKGSA